MKKWIVYYVLTFTFITSLAFIFNEHTDVHSFWPLIPVFFMVLSFFLSLYHYREDVKERTDTDASPKRELNYEEQYDLSMCQYITYGVSIPFYLPVLFFVPNIFKLSSILVFIITIASGPIYFRIKHGKRVKERIAKEEAELKAQKQKEELGKR